MHTTKHVHTQAHTLTHTHIHTHINTHNTPAHTHAIRPFTHSLTMTSTKRIHSEMPKAAQKFRARKGTKIEANKKLCKQLHAEMRGAARKFRERKGTKIEAKKQPKHTVRSNTHTHINTFHIDYMLAIHM